MIVQANPDCALQLTLVLPRRLLLAINQIEDAIKALTEHGIDASRILNSNEMPEIELISHKYEDQPDAEIVIAIKQPTNISGDLVRNRIMKSVPELQNIFAAGEMKIYVLVQTLG